MVNHLNSNHENTNLLFYNFNAYNDASNVGNIHDSVSVERVPTRGVKSRKEFRER